MPITVVCQSCLQRFQVSDKFAGRQGPCPKCKATIYIPKPDEQVKIHTPEHSEASARGATGQLVLKPIAREKTRLKTWQIVILVGGSASIWIAALVLRWFPDIHTTAGIVGLIILSPLLAAGAYTFLRDPDLEPYSGTALWLRSAICGAVYAGCWALYRWWLPGMGLTVTTAGEIWKLAFLAPAFGVAGAIAALATFDFEPGNGFFHFCFFVVITIVLALTMGVQL